MKSAIKAELRKLLSIRSTYFIAGFSTLLVAFLSFYARGIKSITPVSNTGEIADTSMIAVSVVGIILAIAATLLVTHEYRYNTVTYTLTAAHRRNEMLLSKVVAVTVFSLAMCIFIAILAPILHVIGWKIQGISYVQQQLPVLSILWKVALVGWGYSMYALIIAFIARSVVVSAVALFLLPSTIENLLGILLKTNQAYLPFTALNSIMQRGAISQGAAAFTVLGYIATGLVISWYLLNRRDAN